jgi:hypothetical protein
VPESSAKKKVFGSCWKYKNHKHNSPATVTTIPLLLCYCIQDDERAN